MARQRIVLITGATRGIGAAIAETYFNENTKVILTGTNPAAKKNYLKNIKCEYWEADFSTKASIKKFLKKLDSLEQLDVCINNAGINIIKTIDEIPEYSFDKLMSINLRAPYFISQSAARIMKKQRRGWILNVGSIWSVITKSGRSIYSASKSGIVGMTRAFAVELASYNIMVNCISPGFVMTDLTKSSLSSSEIIDLSKHIPVNRFALPEEIAQCANYLCSTKNTYLTGQNIVVDGGFSII